MKEINLGEALQKHKNKAINIAIIILALLLGRNIYQQQIKVADSLKERKETEEKKNTVLEDIKQLEKKIQGYSSFVNRKDISVAMNIMSEIAQAFSINVISLKPEVQQENPLYTRYFFVLKLETDSYHYLGKFISTLESRSELYSVQNLRISPMYSLEQQRKWLSIDLTVSTILLKE